jgi:hypothetical protein
VGELRFCIGVSTSQDCNAKRMATLGGQQPVHRGGDTHHPSILSSQMRELVLLRHGQTHLFRVTIWAPLAWASPLRRATYRYHRQCAGHGPCAPQRVSCAGARRVPAMSGSFFSFSSTKGTAVAVSKGWGGAGGTHTQVGPAHVLLVRHGVVMGG